MLTQKPETEMKINMLSENLACFPKCWLIPVNKQTSCHYFSNLRKHAWIHLSNPPLPNDTFLSDTFVTDASMGSNCFSM